MLEASFEKQIPRAFSPHKCDSERLGMTILKEFIGRAGVVANFATAVRARAPVPTRAETAKASVIAWFG
jgi:hypothetical protein